ncbi:MAG: diacylglycerol/lipid kinase family protein [Candidatus Saccharibacteria bacterium]
MEAVLITNPASGSYNKKKIEEILNRLRAGGVSVDLCETEYRGMGTEIARDTCLKRPGTTVIACGGDGTINEALNGLVQGATMGIIPMGSANVLAKEVGVRTVDKAVEAIIKGRTRKMSIGLLRRDGQNDHRFMLMAGIGADGKVTKEVNLEEKKVIGNGAYVLTAIRTLIKWDDSLVDLLVDGKPMRCHTAVVCNASKYGGSFVLAPGASVFEPEFKVVYSTTGRRWATLGIFIGAVAGLKTKNIIPAQEVEFIGRKPVQIDGDFFDYSPMKVSILPDFCNIVC